MARPAQYALRPRMVNNIFCYLFTVRSHGEYNYQIRLVLGLVLGLAPASSN